MGADSGCPDYRCRHNHGDG